MLLQVIVTRHRLLDGLRGLLSLLSHLLGRTACGSSRSLLGHALSFDSLGACGVGGNLDLVAAVVADESSEVFDSAGTRIIDWVVLGASLEELDGRETLDLVGHVVGGSVDLGDDDFVTVLLVQAGQLVILGCEGLAVSTPWGVELKEDVLVVVDDHVLIVLGNHYCDGTILLLWDRLALNGWLDLPRNEVLHEFADVICAQVRGRALLAIGKLLILLGVLNGESGPGTDFEIEVATVLTESGSIDGGEANLALDLLSDGPEVLGDRFALLDGLGEDIGEWDAGL